MSGDAHFGHLPVVFMTPLRNHRDASLPGIKWAVGTHEIIQDTLSRKEGGVRRHAGESSALAAVLRAGAAMVDSRLVNKPIRSPPTASNGPKRPFPCGLRKARLNDSSHHSRRSLSKISAHYVTATTRRDLDASADHFQVYTGQVRMGTIYKRESRGSTNIVRNTSGSRASFLPRCRWARAASTSPTASRVCSARSCAMPRPNVAIRLAVSSS